MTNLPMQISKNKGSILNLAKLAENQQPILSKIEGYACQRQDEKKKGNARRKIENTIWNMWNRNKNKM